MEVGVNRRILVAICLTIVMTVSLLAPTAGQAQAADLTKAQLADATGATAPVDPASTGPAESLEPQLENLGPALVSPNVGTGAAGPDMEGGSLIYATSSGHPPSFTVLDGETGEVVFQTSVEGEENLSAKILPTDAGLTYVSFRSGAATQFYVYDVQANTFEPAVRACRDCEIDKTVFRVFDVADDGTLYMGSYPDATVFSWDPETDEVRDYGPVFTEGQYIWGLTLAGDQLFVGTGNGPDLGLLFQVDTVSGDITQVEYPEEAVTPNVIRDLGVVDDIVLVPLNGDDHDIRMYDAVNEEWVCEDTPAPGHPQPADSFAEWPIDGKTYFRTGDSAIYEVEPATCTYRDLGIAETGVEDLNISGVKIVPTGPAEDPALDSLLAFRADGSYIRFDPEEGAVQDMPSSVLPAPQATRSIGLGPDETIYIGGFLSPDIMGRMDLDSEEVEVIDGPEQADTITTVGDHLVASAYPNAVISSGDMDQPWQWGENPRELFNGAADGQDRIFEIIDADGLGISGSVPGYALLGGGLTVFDPETGDHETYLDLVADQQPGALAHRDGVVYVGTTTQGGAGAGPTADEAVLFEFDLDSRSLTQQMVPVPEASTIGALEFGDDELWGMSDTGVLFQYDPHTHDVIDELTIAEFDSSTNWGALPILAYSEVEEIYYGIAATRDFFTFDPDTQEVTVIDEEQEWTGLEVLADGQIYLIDERDVYRYGDAGGMCTETITDEHIGALRVSEGVTCVDGATVRGPITVEAGAGTVITDSQTVGPLTAQDARLVEISHSELRGRISVGGTTETLALISNEVRGPVELDGNSTQGEPVVSDNAVQGPLRCTDNEPAPTNDDLPNTVSGRSQGQCSGL